MAELATGDFLQRKQQHGAWTTIHTITAGDVLYLFRGDVGGGDYPLHLGTEPKRAQNHWTPNPLNATDRGDVKGIAPNLAFGNRPVLYYEDDGLVFREQATYNLKDKGVLVPGIGYIVPAADAFTGGYLQWIRTIATESGPGPWQKRGGRVYYWRIRNAADDTTLWDTSTNPTTRDASVSDETLVTGGVEFD